MFNTILSAVVLGATLSSVIVQAQLTEPTPPTFMSGGVGDEDRIALEATEKSYSFKLVLAGAGGAFLDDVHVTITDAAKKDILVTNTEGPILLVQLEPGKYTVRAEVQGLTQTQAVTIKKNRHTNITIRFPLSE